MKVTTLTPTQALHPAYRKVKIVRQDIDRLKAALPLLLDRTTGKVSESTLRDHFQTFLRHVAFPEGEFLLESEVNRMDTVIHDGPKRKDPVGVIIEAKTSANTNEMFSPGRPNTKALRELVLYFLRERAAGNVGIKSLMITNGDEVYVFPDGEFERLFWNKKRFRKKILELDADAGKNNDIVYEAIGEHLDGLADEDPLSCGAVHLSLFRKYCEDGDPITDDDLLPLYKLLSPAHLLRRPFAGDSNHLDKKFYRELLHLIGLEEVGVDSKGKLKKNGGKKIIRRLPEGQRHPASLLENTLQVARKENRFRHTTGFNAYGKDQEEREFAVGLELCLTWVNRILFLKLLETQLVAYHEETSPLTPPRRRGEQYRFISSKRIPDYDALNTLFFDVLNKPVGEREDFVADFAHVPYLNSSLFEISELEDQVIRVNSLKDQHELPLAPQSVLRTRDRAQNALPPLEYLFAFLDAYDFGSEGRARIQEDNKRLINASVLGLIFEKINGYRDGSFYTPGFITEYMCRETIRRAVVQKFREDTTDFADFDADTFADLTNYLARKYKTEELVAANRLVNSLTICDPAVGSGHFLVSALNELIATKSDLGILGADAGARDVNIEAVIANDELLLSYRRTGDPYEYHVDTDSNGQPRIAAEVQAIQRTLFEEKRTLIENCLFGVDLNPNSVKICRLRLWIELLKHAYYVLPDERSGRSLDASERSGAHPMSRPQAYLQTLPNIDINIKQGNSLISRFALDDDLSAAFKRNKFTLQHYREAVSRYHRASGSDEKRELRTLMETIKDNFRVGANSKDLEKYTKAKGKLDQLKGVLEMGDLFGSVNEKQVAKEIAKQEAIVAKELVDYEKKRDDVIFDGAFEWRFEFPRVLGEGGEYLGFDVVVGNPPYVDIKALDSTTKDYLFENYKTSTNRINLYSAFIELGTEITSEQAQFSFIVPNSMLVGSSYGKTRELLMDNLNQVIKLPDNVFEDATVETIIFRLSLSHTPNSITAITYGNADDVESIDNSLSVEIDKSFLEEYSSGTINLYLSKEIANVIMRASNDVKPVNSVTDISLGITPYDKYQGHDEETIKTRAFHATTKVTSEYKPLISGKNINHYYIEVKPDEFIRYGPWLGSARDIKYFTKPRNIVRQIVGNNLSLVSGYTDQEAFFTQIGFSVIASDESCSDKFLTAIFNSKLLAFIHKYLYLDIEKKVFQKVLIQNFKQLPVKLPKSIETREKLESLTTQILHQKQLDPTADTSALEAEIDVLVYKLYGLTYAEVLVVDAGFGLGEEAYEKMEVT